MAAGYIGIGGVAKKIKGIYFGVGGVAKKVKKAYIGVGGVAKLWYTSGPQTAEFERTVSPSGGFTRYRATGVTGNYLIRFKSYRESNTSYPATTAYRIDYSLTQGTFTNVSATAYDSPWSYGGTSTNNLAFLVEDGISSNTYDGETRNASLTGTIIPKNTIRDASSNNYYWSNDSNNALMAFTSTQSRLIAVTTGKSKAVTESLTATSSTFSGTRTLGRVAVRFQNQAVFIGGYNGNDTGTSVAFRLNDSLTYTAMDSIYLYSSETYGDPVMTNDNYCIVVGNGTLYTTVYDKSFTRSRPNLGIQRQGLYGGFVTTPDFCFGLLRSSSGLTLVTIDYDLTVTSCLWPATDAVATSGVNSGINRVQFNLINDRMFYIGNTSFFIYKVS